MNEPKFKVGDKVRVLDGSKIDGYTGEWANDTMTQEIGKTHVIIDIDRNRPRIGYNLDFRNTEWGDPFVWDERGLKLVPDKKSDLVKIIITTDGKTTLARLYEEKKVVKSAEAHCSPDDKFDFFVGANLAMERLTGKTTAIQVSVEIPKGITDKLEAIKATGKAFVKALEEFK